MVVDPSILAMFNDNIILRGSSATYPFDPVCQKPMEALREQEKTKHNGKGNVKFVAKDCECQQRFRHEEPCAVIESLLIVR